MNRWQRLWRREQLEDKLDKELRFHIDQHVADLIAHGHDPQEARRKARIELGGAEQVKEQCRDARGTRWVEDLVHDLRYALRTMRQNPGFTAVALCTLALGIGATTVMFTVVKSVVLAPLPYPDPSRLIAVHAKSDKLGDSWALSYPDLQDLRDTTHTLQYVGAWTYGGGGSTLTGPGEPEHVDVRNISASLFQAFGVRLAMGRAFLPEEDKPNATPVAIISYKLWRERFGGAAEAAGAHVVLDGTSFTVVGIAPASFGLEGDADVYTPLGQVQLPRMSNRAARFIHVVARLAPGVSMQKAQSELALIGRRLADQFPQFNAGFVLLPHPLTQDVVGDVTGTLWLLLGAVAFVLLIACVNIASLLLARAVSRDRELAMRAALGAGRGRLVRQCLTETGVLGLLGGALGVVLAVLSTPLFVTFWPEGSLPRADEIHIDWQVLLFALAVSLASGFLFGLAPALRASARQALHSGTRTVGEGSRRLHGAFVSAELALTVILLICAGVLGRTILRLSSLDPGFRRDNVLAARVALDPKLMISPMRARDAWQSLPERLRKIPGVESAAVVDIVPMRIGINTLPYRTSPAPLPLNQTPSALATAASPEYLQVMGVPLVRGRFIEPQDRLDAPPVVVIDEVLARKAFGSQNPVGQRLWVPALGREPVTVVGVVRHVRYWGLARDDSSDLRDQMYYPFAQVPDSLMGFFSSIMSVVIHTGAPAQGMIAAVRQALRGDEILYEIHTMDELASDSLGRQRFLVVLFGIFAGLALMLACIGIYGVLAYLTRQRVPEIGVRMALGASSGDVLRMVLRQSLIMIIAGVAVGVGGAIAAARVLQRLVDGVQPTGPATYAAMLALLFAAALLASFLPARRASLIDPLTALRQE